MIENLWNTTTDVLEDLVEILISFLERLSPLLSWEWVLLFALILFRREVGGILEDLIEVAYSKGTFSLKRLRKEDLKKSDSFIEPPKISRVISLIEQKKKGVETAGALFRKAFEASKSSDNASAIEFLKHANLLMPNDIYILHSLGTVLIRQFKSTKKIEFVVEAEIICKQAISAGPSHPDFPYGTLYNLARAQAFSGNLIGLRETLKIMQQVELPDNLGRSFAEGDGDFDNKDINKFAEEIVKLNEYISLQSSLKTKYNI